MLEQPENFLGARWTDPKGTSLLPSSMKNAFDPWRVLNSTGCLACNPCFPLISCQAPAGRGSTKRWVQQENHRPKRALPQHLPSPAAGGWGPGTCQAMQGSGGLVSGHSRTGVSLTPWGFWARPEMFQRSKYKGGRLHCIHVRAASTRGT